MNQKGFANSVVLIALIIVLAGVESYFVLSRKVSPPPIITPTITPNPISTTTTPTPPPANIESARTLYEGYVGIETISLSEIKNKLEARDCHTNDYKGDRGGNWCMYRETEVSQLKEDGIEIYPHGPGFGPISFYVTENKLWADKDIPGTPNPDKFKEEVRQDVKGIGNIVTIRENSWKITKTEYPWTVIY